MKKVNLLKTGLFLLTLAICQNLLLAQTSPLHENIIPPSPQASDLGKYSEATINHQSGTPNISIPLHTIQGKDINHSISLSYDASGRKVGEVASWVGLGWTLQAGGIITRTVRGLPDEHANGYFSKYPDYKLTHEPNYLDSAFNPRNDRHSPEANFLKECYEGTYDLLPDVYSFNFNGHQGQIMFDGITKRPIIVPHKNYKIERDFYNDQGIYKASTDAWTITTGDGTIYKFEHADIETTNSLSPAGFFISAWHLSSIENYNKTEKISFTYNSIVNNQGSTRYSVSSTKYVKSNTSQESCNYPGPGPLIFDDPDRYTTKYLTAISYSFSNNPILNVSLYSTDPNVTPRLDKTPFTPKLNTLNAITVNDLVENSIIKTFSFSHEYFGSTHKRLKLTEFQEVGKPAYTFDYYEQSTLPDYESFSIDHWGFFNNKSNTSLIPKTPPEIASSGYYQPNPIASADRGANASTANVYLLKRMNYPTGGYADYEYEPHRSRRIEQNCKEYVSTAVRASSDEISHGPMSPLELQIRNMFDDGDTQLVGGLPNVQAEKITILESQYVNFHLTASAGTFALPTTTLLYSYPLPSQWDQNLPFSYPVSKYLEAGDYVLVSMVAEDLDNITMKSTMEYYTIYPTCIKTDIIGGARIKQTTLHDADVTTENDIVYNYEYTKDYVSYLNGILSSENDTTDDDGPVDGSGPIATDTTIATGGTGNLPSGIAAIDLYESSLKVHYMPVYLDTKICGDLIASAYNFDPFAKNLGSHVGYGEVTVVKGGMENGLSVYKYRNGANANFRSQPILETHYKFDSLNNQFEEVKKTDYEYTSHYYGALVEGVKVDVTSVELYGCVPPAAHIPGFDDCEYYNVYNIGQVAQAYYSYGTSFIGLAMKTELLFDQERSQSIVTEYKYDFATSGLSFGEFGDVGMDQPTLEIVRNINTNKSYYKRFHYPYSYGDYPSHNGINLHLGLDGLKNQHVVNFLVSTESGIIEGIDDNEVYKKTDEHISFPEQLQNSTILTTKVLQFETSQPDEELDSDYSFARVLPDISSENEGYDIKTEYQYNLTNTNLIQATPNDGIDRAFIWGYGAKYPVVQILGATYLEAETVLGGPGFQLLGPNNHYLSDDQINLLRINLPQGTQITTYTYKPGIGIETVTDPNGFKTEYTYDSSGRLGLVKDHDGNILSKYDYLYKQ